MDASFLAGPRADFPAQPRMFSNEEYFLSNGCTAWDRGIDGKKDGPRTLLSNHGTDVFLLRRSRSRDGSGAIEAPLWRVDFRARIGSDVAKNAMCAKKTVWKTNGSPPGPVTARFEGTS